MAVKHIKLINGESVVTDVKSENEYSLECLTPMMTAINQSPTGDVLIAFVRWLPFSDIDVPVSIKKSSILIMVDVTPGINEHFKNVLIQLHAQGDDETVDVQDESNVIEKSKEEVAFDNILQQKGMSITSKLKN